jgi:hypothetical protein
MITPAGPALSERLSAALNIGPKAGKVLAALCLGTGDAEVLRRAAGLSHTGLKCQIGRLRLTIPAGGITTTTRNPTTYALTPAALKACREAVGDHEGAAA